MKIYISHAGDYDYEAELYEPIRTSDLYKHHEFFLPHESHNVDVSARNVLKTTDLLVAEVSSPSTGQGIELGLAAAMGVPIACFYKTGAKPSGSLRFVTDTCLPYDTAADLLQKLTSFISRTDRSK